jgi:hypothetical protein
LADLLDNQIVLIIDLLGFTESTSSENSVLQGHVLSLLKHIASMRSDFDLNATVKADWGSAHDITLAVSTFSDHIVISVPFDRIRSTEGIDDFAPAVALFTLGPLVATVATASLRLGFLIRGGMSYGKLYHSGGVVFGPALIDAVSLESKSAVYPRIVLSKSAADLFSAVKSGGQLARDYDGMTYLNFYRDCLSATILSGGKPNPNWFPGICKLVEKNLQELSGSKRAKWFYFARKLADASSAMSHDTRTKLHIDPSKLPRLE